MDWTKLITDLEVRGWTQAQIGAAVGGVSQNHISDLKSKRTAEPRYECGRELVALHERVMRRSKKVPA
jgi:hypothetical protein